MMVAMPRTKTLTPAAWTPNQIVAHNISKARLLRGWTQEEAAEACEPFLGTKLSNASWSALERSVDGNRIRQIDADELIGFARGFDLPIGWFLTPPSALDGHVVATPDAGPDGLDPAELFDVVIGTDTNLETWEQYLLSWPAGRDRIRLHPDGTIENVPADDVHHRTRTNTMMRARMLVREHFGDITAARDVLTGLAELLDNIDRPETTPDDTPR